jgi:hypothetical protein
MSKMLLGIVFHSDMTAEKISLAHAPPPWYGMEMASLFYQKLCR